MRANLFLAILCLAVFAVTGTAQIALNEIYASHAGTDDQEYFELYSVSGTDSLANHVLCVVEGESSSAFGTLDVAIDLSALTFTSNYLVVGDDAVTPNALMLGASNNIENGTLTVYLVDAGSPAGVSAITALVATDISTGANTTMLPSLGTIVDSVGMSEGGADVIYDGATVVGPDGTFFPSGIFRDADFPNGWCTSAFLDFDDVVNAAEPRTPGATNTACPAIIPPTYPGNGTDAEILFRINGSIDDPSSNVHLGIASTDVYSARYQSPSGGNTGAPFFAAVQAFATGSVTTGIPFPVANIIIDLGIPLFIVFDGLTPGPINIPVLGFSEISFAVPPTLYGVNLSLIFTLILPDTAIASGFGVAEAHELQLP